MALLDQDQSIKKTTICNLLRWKGNKDGQLIVK